MTVNVITTPLTDHNAVSISIPLCSANTKINRNTYWKLKNSLLQHKIVKLESEKLILQFWNKAKIENSFCSNWELFKFKVSQYLQKYSSISTKSHRMEEEKVISRIATLSQKSPINMSDEDRLELTSEQRKLNEMHSDKAKGALFRSRKK